MGIQTSKIILLVKITKRVKNYNFDSESKVQSKMWTTKQTEYKMQIWDIKPKLLGEAG